MNTLTKTISGSVYDSYTPTSQDFKEGRMPTVGDRACYEDGRKFVFCSSAVDVAAGSVVACASVNAELTAVSAAVPTGTYDVSFVLASVAANDYRDGYLTVTLGDGVGVTYRIASNTASATIATVDNTVVVTLVDPIHTALAATDNILIKKDRHTLVVAGTADLDSVGVAAVTTTAATGSTTAYFWVQYEGVGFVLGTVADEGVACSPAASAAVAASDGTKPIVCVGIEAGASNSMANLCFPG